MQKKMGQIGTQILKPKNWAAINYLRGYRLIRAQASVMPLLNAGNEAVRDEHGAIHKIWHELCNEVGSLHNWLRVDLAWKRCWSNPLLKSFETQAPRQSFESKREQQVDGRYLEARH